MIGESIGNHRVVGKLGQGGMGAVYQAEDKELGRRVAIKILNPSFTREANALERFRTEAKVQASLNHPNIVTLYSFEPFRDSYCIIMEYVLGKNMADIVREYGALPTHVVVTFAKQILDGLAAAHRLGIVHRDLKPSNVMMTSEGIVKVMDFGIAKMTGGSSLTASGELVGSVFYMSPEQIKGEKIDARSDIYSFGIILFELLTGRVPFKEDSDFSIMIHHVQTPPPPPTQFLQEIPGSIEDLVLRCLEKDPANRFQSAEEIITLLDGYEEQQRAEGRGQLYTRRNLIQWLGSSEGRVADLPAVETPPANAGPAELPETDILPHPQGQTPDPVRAASQPSRRKGVALLMVLVAAILILGGTAGYFLVTRGLQYLSSETPAIAEATPDPTIPAADPSSPSSAAEPAQSVAASSAPSEKSGAADTSSRSRPKSSPPGALDSGAAPAARPTPDESPRPQPPAEPSRAESKLIFVSMALDQSGEALPLEGAQLRVAEVLRENGQEVLSGLAASAPARSALERGDMSSIRGMGIGYVVSGTAHGSLEPQNAFGKTYYAGAVKITLEVLRTTDGRVLSTATGTAKSRGTANAEAALESALVTAVSDAARRLLRQWTP